MPIFTERACTECGEEFLPTGPAAKYCPSCKEQKEREHNKRDHIRDMIKRGRSAFIGVGKGGNVAKGKNSPHWVNGTGFYKRIKNDLFINVGKVCQRCGCDLSSFSAWHWVCHHKDHDRKNNEFDNLEILCKSCHQKEHESWRNFRTCNDYPEME